jgi:acyl-lipid omega-6 desaturase (Delta-12 desaturase)
MDKAQYIAIRKSQDLAIKPLLVLAHYIREVALVTAIYFVWNQTSYAKYFAIPLIASLLFRSFSSMHDAVHKAVSKNNWFNDFVGVMAGGVCLLPFEHWRRSHLEHHTWSGNLDKDPVTAFITIFPKLPPKVKQVLNFFWMSWIPLLAMVQYMVFWSLASKITLQNKLSPKLALSLAAPVFVWAAAFALTPLEFSLGALLPGVILYFTAVEVVNFPHHLQLPQYHGETRFPFWEQYKISRSCIYPKWFATWVVLNFNYHTEHHLFPDVPWYHLPKLQAPVRDVLGSAYNTDPHFAWIIENKPKRLEAVIHYDNSNNEQPNQKAA